MDSKKLFIVVGLVIISQVVLSPRARAQYSQAIQNFKHITSEKVIRKNDTTEVEKTTTRSVIPNVNFILGAEYSFGMQEEEVLALILDTSFLGAATGSVFEVLGAGGLKTYLTKYLSGTISFPLDNSDKVGGQIGLGLGEIRFNKGRRTILPVLGIEQFHAGDARVPGDLLDRSPDETTWSAPEFSFGILWKSGESVTDDIDNNKAILILSFGIRLPFYYPGDSFSAIAALFTEDRSRYVKSGKIQFQVGLALAIPNFQLGNPKVKERVL